MMADAGWSFKDGTFVTDGGKTNVLNSAAHALQTSDAFKASYFVQRDYVDRLWSDFGGDANIMVAALQRDVGGATGGVSQAMANMLPGLTAFARQFDVALNGGVPQVPLAATTGMWNQELAAKYANGNHSALFQQIANDFAD
jgi:hypothetical protein